MLSGSTSKLHQKIDRFWSSWNLKNWALVWTRAQFSLLQVTPKKHRKRPSKMTLGPHFESLWAPIIPKMAARKVYQKMIKKKLQKKVPKVRVRFGFGASFSLILWTWSPLGAQRRQMSDVWSQNYEKCTNFDTNFETKYCKHHIQLRPKHVSNYNRCYSAVAQLYN